MSNKISIPRPKKKLGEISVVAIERGKNGKIKNTEWWTEEEFYHELMNVSVTLSSRLPLFYIDARWWDNMPWLLRAIVVTFYYKPRIDTFLTPFEKMIKIPDHIFMFIKNRLRLDLNR